MEEMVMNREHRRGWSGWFAIIITSINPQKLLLATTCDIPILWVWVIKNQWLQPLLSMYMFEGSRERSSQCQPSQGYFTHWVLDAALIGSIAEVGELFLRIVVLTVWSWVRRTGCMAGKGKWEWNGERIPLEDAPPYLSDNLRHTLT